MDSPVHTKRRRTDSSDLSHCCVISEEEAKEIEEVDSKSDCNEGDSWGDLASRDMILISKLRPEDYANAISWLQGMGIAVVQDDLPYSTPTATMALDIPLHKVEEVALLLTSKWELPGCISIGQFQPMGNLIKLAI